MNDISTTLLTNFESVTLSGDSKLAVYKATCGPEPIGYVAVPVDQLRNVMILTNHALASAGSPVQIGAVDDFAVADHPNNPNSRLLTFRIANGPTISIEISRLNSMLLSDNLMTRL